MFDLCVPEVFQIYVYARRSISELSWQVDVPAGRRVVAVWALGSLRLPVTSFPSRHLLDPDAAGDGPVRVGWSLRWPFELLLNSRRNAFRLVGACHGCRGTEKAGGRRQRKRGAPHDRAQRSRQQQERSCIYCIHSFLGSCMAQWLASGVWAISTPLQLCS